MPGASGGPPHVLGRADLFCCFSIAFAGTSLSSPLPQSDLTAAWEWALWMSENCFATTNCSAITFLVWQTVPIWRSTSVKLAFTQLASLLAQSLSCPGFMDSMSSAVIMWHMNIWTVRGSSSSMILSLPWFIWAITSESNGWISGFVVSTVTEMTQKNTDLHTLWKCWLTYTHKDPRTCTPIASHGRSWMSGANGWVAGKLVNDFLSSLRRWAWTGENGGTELPLFFSPVMNASMMVSGLESCTVVLICKMISVISSWGLS